MKRNSIFLIMILLAVLLSCNTEEKVNGNGYVRIGVVTNTSVITKAEDNAEINNIRLVITNVTDESTNNKWSKEYNFAPDAILDKIELAPGKYKLEAVASRSEVEVGFTPAYRGETEVEVKAGETASAKIECLLTTVKVAVMYDADVIGTYQAEFETVIGGVTFGKEEKRAGYITPGDLSIQFRFKDKEGNWQSIDLNKITEAKARDFYQITISMKPAEGGDDSTEGAANVTIKVGEKNPQDIQIGIKLPVITIGCDATNVEYTTATLEGAYSAPSGNEPPAEKKIFYYRKKGEPSSAWTEINASGIKSVEHKYQVSLGNLTMSTTYEYKFMEKGEVKEFTTKTPDITLDKNYRGVTSAVVYGELAEVNKNTVSDPFFKYRKDSAGEWSQAITATQVSDGQYKAILEGLDPNATYEYKFMEVTVEEKQFTTLASIQLLKAITGADYVNVTIDIQNVKEGDNILLDLKKYNGNAWLADKIECTLGTSDLVDGKLMKKVSGLDQNGTYCIDDETKSFTTLYNANFDNWYTYKKAQYPGINGSEANCFWDTGNVGATTMSKNPTSQESSIVHSVGGSSAKLASQFVGFLGIGKFAAGNVYVGHYRETFTSPMGARIRMGREFTSSPTQLRGWYRYTRGTKIDYDGGFGKKEELTNSGGDKCAIYMALTDNDGLEEDGVKTAYEIHNNNANSPTRYTLDLSTNNPDVVAYGSIADEESNGTEGWKEFTINLDYRKPQSTPKFLILVASASKYGDFFTGSKSSIMYLDDFELVYDYTKPPYTN